MISPVFIPSKGRSEFCKTAKLLSDYVLVVEPQELVLYKKEFPEAKFLVLPESNRGIGYVRQQILTHARELGLASYWMLDDDITGLYEIAEKKCKKFPAEQVLARAQRVFERDPLIMQGALEYQQYAWAAKHEIKYNSYCDVAVWIRPGLLPHLNYRPRMDLKEDRDFTLQILANGMRTARSSWTAFSAPKNGSNSGGLYDEYAKKGRELQAVLRMCEAWPGICTPQVKPDGRNDLKILWSHFKLS